MRGSGWSDGKAIRKDKRRERERDAGETVSYTAKQKEQNKIDGRKQSGTVRSTDGSNV